MTTLLERIRAWRPGRREIAWGAMAAVWCGLLLGVALPGWRQVQQQHGEINQLEQRLADLDRWSVAGLWLEPSVAAREPQVASAWARLFPADRDREQLFLSLAQVADRSGVQAFQLEEITDLDLVPVEPDAGYDQADDTDDPVDDWTSQRSPGALVAPAHYHVRASFSGDYGRTAAFLSGLAALERAVSVHRLAIRPARSGLDIELEMKIYVDRTHAS